MLGNAVVGFLTIICSGLISAKAELWIPPAEESQLIPKVEFHVQEVDSVMELETREVSFSVTWENNTDAPSDAGVEYLLTITSDNEKVMQIVNSSNAICIRQDDVGNNYTFTVKGLFLGYAKAKVHLRSAVRICESAGIPDPSDNNVILKEYEIAVSVVRPPSILVNAVTGIMAALVAFNYVNMGVQLDLITIGKVLKKPIGPTIGFVCQFLFMPVAAYGISYLLLPDISLRLGLFVLGCSPGGSMSNFWTLLFHGDVNLSVTMTFISTIAALGMMPLWIFTLGRNFFHDKEATIPYVNLAGSLIMLTIPLGFGFLIRQYSPRFTRLSSKIIKPVTLVCVVFGIFVGLYANSFVFQLVTWQVILSGILIAWGGYSFGALMAWVFKLDTSQIIAVSIETAFQNPGVAFVMLLMSLPQPEADLTTVPVIAQLILTGLPMWILLIVTRIYNKCTKSKTLPKEEEPKEIDRDYEPVATNPSRERINNNEEYLISSSGPPNIKIVSSTKLDS